MKKIYLLIVFIISFVGVASAQTTHDKISYQSVVRTSDNHLVYDTWITVTVSIANGDAPSTVVYSEKHTVLSNANGLISFLIGDGDDQAGDWNAVKWNRAEITLVTNANGSVLSTHTYPLSAVPYALYAKAADAAAYADSLDMDVVQHYLDQNGYLPEEPQVLSISNDTIFLTRGGWVKLPEGFSGDYNDLTNKPDLKPVATSGDYNDLVNKPTKSDLCDSVKDCVKGWISDSTRMVFDTLHNYYATKKELRDTASALRDMISAEVTQLQQNIDTVSSHVRGALIDTAAAIRADMGDAAHDAKITIQKNGVTVGDFTLNQATPDTIDITVPTTVAELTDAANYVTNAKLNDTLKAYTTTSQIDTLLGDYAKTADVNDTLSYYTTSNQIDTLLNDYAKTADLVVYEKKDNLCEDVTNCIKDTLASYTTTNQIDTLLGDYAKTADVNDTLGYYTTSNKVDTLLGAYAKTADVKDTLGHYTTTNKVDTLLDAYEKKSDLCTDVTNCIKDTLKHYTTSDKIDTLLGNYATTVYVKDTLKAYFDTTLTKKAIHDTADALRGEFPTVNDGKITINVDNQGTIVENTFRVNQANDQTINITIPQNVAVNDGQLTIITKGDTTRFTANQATKDTVNLSDFVTTASLNDTLKAYTTTDKIDTIVNKHHFLTSDSALIVRMRDSIQKVNAHVSADSLVLATKINADSLKLATRMDTLLKHVCDTVKPCVTGWINDTLSAYYTKKQVNDTLKAYTTTDKIDTIVNKHHFLTSDSALIVRMRDSIQKVNAHVSADSLVLATKINADSLKLATRMDTLLKHVCDTVKPCVTGWINDTLSAYYTKKQVNDTLKAYYDTTLTKKAIHDSIGNGTLTITYGNTPVTFTANQKTPSSITIPAVPTAVVQLTDANDYARRNGNTFTGTHDFTSENTTITVPSKFDIKNPPTSSTCTQDAVNICDLLSVFDSLSRRLAAVEAELASLKTGLPVFVSLTFSEITFNSMKATAEFTNSGAPISFYRFCISKNEDMSDPIGCYITTTPEYTFVNLDPKTLYYVSVTATNAAGTSEPGKRSERTLANITIALNGPDSVTYACGTTDPEPHYTITVKDEGEDITSQCSFVWKVNNVKVDSSTNSSFDTSYFKEVQATIEESMIVTCTVILTADTLKRTDTVTTIVTNNPYSLPVISICISDLIITDRGSQNIVAVKWESADENFTSATALNHTYHETGSHTITVKSATGCETDTTITFVPLTPCAVGNHPAQTSTVLATAGIENSTNGLETTNDGGAVTKVQDFDGNMYAVVQIGTQCWLAENLRTTSYGDGTEIVVGSSASAETPYIYYPNGEATNLNEYGFLYNWQAATYAQTTTMAPSGIQGVCPAGWHIPSENEWEILDLEVNGSALDFNNSFNSDGNFTGKLAKGCGWKQSANALAPGNFSDEQRNVTGFGAVPAGWYTSENYTGFESSAAFWTCTEQNGENKIYTRHLNYDTSAMNRPHDDQLLNRHAYSVRCIRDDDYNPVALTITAGQNDITICSNDTGAVTYTAKVTRYNKDFTSDYTYEWSVEDADLVANGSSCTVTYTSAGDYTVTCTVKQGSDVVTEKSVTTTVNVLQAPVFTTCEEGYDETNQGYLVKLMSLNQDATFNWGDNSSSTNVDVDTITDNGQKFVINGTITHIYSAQGTPTITATSNSNGCAATKQIALGNTTIHACSSSLFTNHTQQAGTQVSGTTHYEGREEVNTDGNLVSVQDYDGHVYPVVQIGSQCWIAENLRSTHYADGIAITDGTTVPEGSLTQGYYYPTAPGDDPETYGNYYNWYATTRGIPWSETNSLIPGVCPTGWHVPSKSEWETMLAVTHAGDSAVKIAKSCDWGQSDVPNLPGDYNSIERNAYGFGAVPADWYVFTSTYGFFDGEYDHGKTRAIFWSSFENGDKAFYLNITSSLSTVNLTDYGTSNKVIGMPVRCIRNTTNEIPNPTVLNITRSGSSRRCNNNDAVVTYTAEVNQNGTNIADHQDVTYVWSLNGTEDPNVHTKSYTVTYTATTPICTVSCRATTPNVGTLEKAISHSVESGTIPGPFTPVKDGNKVTVSLVGVDPRPDMIYWGDNTEEVQIFNSTTQVSHIYNENGEYTITALRGYIDDKGNDNSCKLTRPVTIAAPVASLEPASSEVSFCVGGSTAVGFTAQIKEGEDDVTSNFAPYTWSVVPQSGSPADGAQITPACTTNVCSVTVLKPGTYTVSCTTATHNSVQLKKTATVTASYKTAPTFNEPTVSGRTVTLTGVANTTSINWGDETSTTVGSSTEVSHTYNENSTGDGYHIIATNSGTECTKEKVVPVSLTMNINVEGSTDICTDGTVGRSTEVTYTASVTDNGTPNATGYSYVWSVDGVEVPGATNATYSRNYTATGTYAVSCTASKTTGDVTASTSTNIDPLPTPSFTTSVNGLTVTLNPLTNTNQIIWDNSDPNTTQSFGEYPTSAVHNYETQSEHTYTIVATNTATGCSITDDEVNVIPPALTLTADNESPSICSAGATTTAVIYNATVNDGGQNTHTYEWTVTAPDGVASPTTSENGASFEVTYSATGDYTVSCTVDGTGPSDTKNVHVSASTDEPSFTWSVSGNTVTLGEIDNVEQVNWGESGTFEPLNNDDPSHVYPNPETETHYTIIAKSPSGCTTEAEVTVAPVVASMEITTCGVPTLCRKSTVTGKVSAIIYKAEVTDAVPTGYIWSVTPSENTTLYSYGDSCMVLYTATGTYQVSCEAEGISLNKTETTEIKFPTYANGTLLEDDNEMFSNDFQLCKEEHDVQLKYLPNIANASQTIYWGDGAMDLVEQCHQNCAPLPSHTYTEYEEYPLVIVTRRISSLYNNVTCAIVRNITIETESPTSCPGVTSWLAKETVDGNNLVSVEGYDENGDTYNYKVVKIGSHCWLAENMRADQYANGDPFSNETYNPGGDVNNVAKYGKLYNLSAATKGGTAQGVCPNGWHVPTNSDWSDIITSYSSGGMLAKGCDWKVIADAAGAPGDYSYSQRNVSGFGALPAGTNGNYSIGNGTAFWCSGGNSILLTYNEGAIGIGSTFAANSGLSVRCVRDARNYKLSFIKNVSNPSVINGPVSVSYTAKIDDGGNTVNSSDFTFSWSVPHSSDSCELTAPIPTTENITITFKKAGTYVVSCTATVKAPGNGEVSGTDSTVVSDATSYTVDLKNSCIVDGTGQVNTNTHYVRTDNETGDTIGGKKIVSAVKDADPVPHSYKVVQIGSQCWMKENLRATKGLSNVIISPGIRVGENSCNNCFSSSNKYYYYPDFGGSYPNALGNDSTSYGLLYNWTAAMDGATLPGAQGMCPTGWHVPTQDDWETLFKSVGGDDFEFPNYNGSTGINSNKLISGVFTKNGNQNEFWTYAAGSVPGNYNRSDADTTGFSILPAGGYTGGFVYDANGTLKSNLKQTAFVWSSTTFTYSSSSNYAYRYSFKYDNAAIRCENYGWSKKQYFGSVRCVRN